MIGVFIFIYAGSDVAVATMRGMGCSLTPTLTAVIRVCGVRLLWIATVFQIPKYHTLYGLYFTYPLSYVLSFVVQITCMIIMYKLIKKRFPGSVEVS